MNKKNINSKLLLGLGGIVAITSPLSIIVSCQNSNQPLINDICNEIQENKNHSTTQEGKKYSPEQIAYLSKSNNKINNEKIWTYIQKPNLKNGYNIKVTNIIGTSIGKKIENSNEIAKESFIRVYYQILEEKDNTKTSDEAFFDVKNGFKDYQKEVNNKLNELEVNNLNWLVNEKGKQKLSSEINKTNIFDFVDGIETNNENIKNKPFLEIESVNPINSKEIEITLVYQLNSFIENRKDTTQKEFIYKSNSFKIKKLSGFLTPQDKDKLDVYKKVNWIKENVVLSLTSKGKNVFASEVNFDNLNEYVQGLPTLNNDEINSGMKIKIVSIEPDINNNINEQKLNIGLQVIQNGFSSEKIIKSVSGFLTPTQKDINDVKELVNSNWTLVANNNAKKVFPSDITLNNINQYVEGLPKTKNDVNVEYFSVKPSKNNEGAIEVEIKFSKNNAIEKVSKIVNGFRILTDQEKFALQVNKDIYNLSITPKGLEVTAWYVNKDTVNEYISGFEKWKNNINWNEARFIPNENETQVTIHFFVKQGNFVTSLTRVVKGFVSKQTEANNNLNKLENIYSNLKVNKMISYKKFTIEVNSLDVVKSIFIDVPNKELRNIETSLKIDAFDTDDALSNTQLKLTWTLKNTLNNQEKVISKIYDNFKDPYGNFLLFDKQDQEVIGFYITGQMVGCGWLKSGGVIEWSDIGKGLINGNEIATKNVVPPTVSKWLKQVIKTESDAEIFINKITNLKTKGIFKEERTVWFYYDVELTAISKIFKPSTISVTFGIRTFLA